MDSPPPAPLPQPFRREASFFGRLVWASAGILGACVVVALAAMAFFVAVCGVLVALSLSLLRRGRKSASPAVLEGRRTADGWVVEAARR
jgi:MFS superfamily sulfate permease-like transporter